MDPLADALGIDVESDEFKRARYLAKQDYTLIMALIRMRADKGISQTEMARRLGVTQATVSAFERMDNDPKLSTIRRYATAVGALVTHNVEADKGQLKTSAEMWGHHSPTSTEGVEGQRHQRGPLTPRNSASPATQHFPYIPAQRSRAAETKRTDHALAA